MSGTLLEVEATADSLPYDEQRQLMQRLSSRFNEGLHTDRGTARLSQCFETLASQWREETAVTSSLTEIATHPAYQRIIGMGSLALPLILRELAKTPDHWFWALKAITGCDPVPNEHRGDLELMAEDWLQWGRSRGYDAS